MEPHPNLADPDFEPTDEQLAELMRRAFAGVRAQQEANLQKIREQIEEASKDVLRGLAAGRGRAPSPR